MHHSKLTNQGPTAIGGGWEGPGNLMKCRPGQGKPGLAKHVQLAALTGVHGDIL